jgi:EAL and modified HD-GYP domain-containing signal transduction protein
MKETSTLTPEDSTREHAGEMRYIARQPILDQRGRLYGYSLLFDTGSDGVIGGKDRESARTILDDVVLFGLERLTGGLPAFIRCTSEALSDQLVAVLPTASTVLCIPASVRLSSFLLDACRNLKNAGFRLALVDFTWSAEPHPLLELVDYVKVDLNRLDALGREKLRQQLQGLKVVMVADRVDTQEGYRAACDDGFTLFQGYYFCHPELIQNAKIPANRLFHFEILRQLQKETLDLKKLCPLVMRDASLVLRLLRLVNSPVCALRNEVNSVESAIIMLGENTFRRVANLAILREINAEQPAELLHMALVRARFCELSASHANLNSSEQYLLGMLSLLPAMLRYPMEELAPELPLRPEIRQALLGEATPERSLLAWVEAHERNQASECYTISKTYGLSEQKLNQFFVDAVMWDMATPRVTA